jgi:hypothetical protein
MGSGEIRRLPTPDVPGSTRDLLDPGARRRSRVKPGTSPLKPSTENQE